MDISRRRFLGAAAAGAAVVRKGMGVIAMKVFGPDQLARTAPFADLLTYALSLPVSLASCGMPRVEFIEQNVALVPDFKPMSESERRRLVDSIAAERQVSMRVFFRQHMDV
jgi:hypothetical protein